MNLKEHPPTIRALIEQAVAQSPEAIAQTFRRGAEWVSCSYRNLYDRILLVAGATSELDVQPKRDRVALMLENGPQWQEIYLAHAGAGVAVVPLDPKLQLAEVVHILQDSQSAVVYLAAKLKELLLNALPKLPHLRHVVLVGGDSTNHGHQEQGCPFWNYELLIERAAQAVATTRDWFTGNIPAAGDVASILYTSGTTGQPKGAMLSHANFCANVESTIQTIPFNKNDNFFVILPLFHAYSFTANFMVPLRLGARMSFAQSIRSVSEDLQALCPTVLMAVPLMAEKMYAKIMPRIKRSFMARLLLLLRLKRIVLRKVIAGMGGKIRFFGVGGAPCPMDIFIGFRKIGFPIVEGYGITECAPGVVYGTLHDYTPGYVGRLIPGMTMRLKDPDEHGVGELQVKGPNVMLGYFNNPEMTAEAFDDGWFRTGDLCAIDKKGFIAIRGRKKALIVNREGKNIYPEEVEQAIALHPLVADVVVLGYHAKNETSGERIGVIVTPELDAIKAAANGTEPPWADIEQTLRQAVLTQSATLAEFKRPRKIIVQRESLQRTSTQKVRRVIYEGTLDE
ncbi:MAG: long-chain fatty acid--CoA ligase [Lentisphaerae bacterium]|nr:long-chain fatty acid--CoA ligase [Lentisphaerota bacterium]